MTLEDPFKHDKLERKAEVDNLSLLLRNISSPIVLSVNAPWGTGKTTFLEMLNADLLNKGCKSIFFNAWETDFAKDPLVAFLGEMNLVLETNLTGNKEKSLAWENAKKAGAHILKKGIPALIKAGTSGIIDTEKLIDEYSKNKSAIESFKENVTKVLGDKEDEISRLYIFIDELDRCRPTYSIELLERIKHLLDIEGLIFILALDKQQLAHSVQGIYGADFDALGYLRRFIDIEYSLQRPELDKFIKQLFETFEFKPFFDARMNYKGIQQDAANLMSVFIMLAKTKQLSLRQVEQLFSKVNLVILSTKENKYLHPELLAFLLFAKEYHSNIYRRYIQEKGTPEEMIELLYTFLPEDERFESDECLLIESFLIGAKINRFNVIEYAGISLVTHKKIIKDENNPENSIRYSENIIRIATEPLTGGGYINLSQLVRKIEMLEQFNFGNDEN